MDVRLETFPQSLSFATGHSQHSIPSHPMEPRPLLRLSCRKHFSNFMFALVVKVAWNALCHISGEHFHRRKARCASQALSHLFCFFISSKATAGFSMQFALLPNFCVQIFVLPLPYEHLRRARQDLPKHSISCSYSINLCCYNSNMQASAVANLAIRRVFYKLLTIGGKSPLRVLHPKCASSIHGRGFTLFRNDAVCRLMLQFSFESKNMVHLAR